MPQLRYGNESVWQGIAFKALSTRANILANFAQQFFAVVARSFGYLPLLDRLPTLFCWQAHYVELVETKA